MADGGHNSGTGQFSDFPAIPTHRGQFVQYNIFGNLFEVTAKYRPPIMPIGRGAYGIVWYLIRFLVFFYFYFSFISCGWIVISTWFLGFYLFL
jgi:hypothetical protein